MAKTGNSNAANRARPEYPCWKAMRDRCRNRTQYVQRRITVCDRWQSFESFVADMGPRPSFAHSIDRRDNNKGYTPENCYWATKTEQNRNKRTNIFIDGKPLLVLAAEINVNPAAMYKRYQYYLEGRMSATKLRSQGLPKKELQHART